MKVNFTVTKSIYSGKERISQSTLATIQVYLTHPIASWESYFVLSEKLAKTIEQTQPGLHCEGIALDYAFNNPTGDYGPETILYSIA